jgi:aryl-alcohol dehydrogenase-like predicted oxidoreductase
MEYRLLGKSDLNISRISFGAMSLKNGEQTNIEIIQQALENGINFFDTADLYDKGKNEEVLGKALKGKRDKVLIATKVGNQWRADGSAWDWNPNPQYILDSIEKSLRRLQTEYVDLYQLHGGTIDDPSDEIIDVFEKLKREGKIRYYGISSIRPNVIREYVKRSSIVSVMNQYSLLDRRAEESVYPLLLEKNIGVLVRGSLAQGLLINKPIIGYLDHSAEEVEKVANTIRKISIQRNAAETAIQFVLRNPAVTSAVVGVRTTSQLKDVVRIFDKRPLTDEEHHELENSVSANGYAMHR